MRGSYFAFVHHSPFDSVPAGCPGAWPLAPPKLALGSWPFPVNAGPREVGNPNQQGARAEVEEGRAKSGPPSAATPGGY